MSLSRKAERMKESRGTGESRSAKQGPLPGIGLSPKPMIGWRRETEFGLQSSHSKHELGRLSIWCR